MSFCSVCELAVQEVVDVLVRAEVKITVFLKITATYYDRHDWFKKKYIFIGYRNSMET